MGRAGTTTVRGLLAALAGEPQIAVAELASAVGALRGAGRAYDAVCVTLDLADSLERAGDPAAAEASRAEAMSFLAHLGCVNAY